MFEDISSYDKLNSLNATHKSEPYEDYFGSMELTDEQRQQRIALAEDLETEFLVFLIMLFHMQKYNSVNYEQARKRLEDGYLTAVKKHMTVDKEMRDYIKIFSYDMVDATKDHEDSLYYYSIDRAVFAAENESAITYDRNDYLQAFKMGKTKKLWVDVRDRRERETHLEVGGEVRPINEPFVVGNSLMMYARDAYTYNPEPKEYINCRCNTIYY